MFVVPHAMHLDERYFERPTEFIPERWLADGRPELVKDKRAFAPFTIGSLRFLLYLIIR